MRARASAERSPTMWTAPLRLLDLRHRQLRPITRSDLRLAVRLLYVRGGQPLAHAHRVHARPSRRQGRLGLSLIKRGDANRAPAVRWCANDPSPKVSTRAWGRDRESGDFARACSALVPLEELNGRHSPGKVTLEVTTTSLERGAFVLAPTRGSPRRLTESNWSHSCLRRI